MSQPPAATSPVSRHQSKRFGAITLCGVVALFSAACQTQKPKETLITSGIVSLGPASDYHAGTASTQFQSRYGIVVTNDSGTVVAVRTLCPRDHTEVRYDSSHHDFICPADGSKWDLLGRPLSGPAKMQPRALPVLAAQRAANGELQIDLDKLNGM